MATGLVKDINTTCHMLGRSDYERIVWTAAAEFPGECQVNKILSMITRYNDSIRSLAHTVHGTKICSSH